MAEYDLIASNGDFIVIVEVKTTMTEGKVDKFIPKLRKYKEKNLDCRDKIIYGGVAYLESEENAHIYAEEQGLFVIEASGGHSSASQIINQKGFEPKEFELEKSEPEKSKSEKS